MHRNAPAWGARAAARMAGIAVLVALAGAALAQTPRSTVPAASDPAETRARAALRLYLGAGQRQPYIATEITRLPDGRVQSSEQLVKHAGAGHTRIEYLAPPVVRGEIVLIAGRRMFRYSPRLGKVLEGPLIAKDLADQRLRALVGRVRRAGLVVRSAGGDTIAGRAATIVEISARGSGRVARRLWIDDRTGVRLKIDECGARQSSASISEYTRIDMTPAIDLRDFQPLSLPDVPHEAMVPGTPPLTTVEAAQRLVSYPVRQPSLPARFRLNGAWVVARQPGAATTILRYTDGATTVTLFQYPVAIRADAPGAAPASPPRLRRGGMTWTVGERGYYLVGYLGPAAVDEVVASLR